LPSVRQLRDATMEFEAQKREAEGKPPIRHRSVTKQKRGSREPVRDVPAEVVIESPVDGQSDEETQQPACDVPAETVPSYPDETSEQPEEVEEQQARPDGDVPSDGDAEKIPAGELMQTVRRYNDGRIPELRIEVRYSLLHLLCPECRDTILATLKEAV